MQLDNGLMNRMFADYQKNKKLFVNVTYDIVCWAMRSSGIISIQCLKIHTLNLCYYVEGPGSLEDPGALGMIYW